MWLFTRTGFYSIVNHDTLDDCYLVRSRTEGDLAALVEAIYPDGDPGRATTLDSIEDKPTADYRWRVVLAKTDVIAQVVQQMADIDYTTSVKDAIDQGDPERHRALLKVWSAMMTLQRGGAYNQWFDDNQPQSVDDDPDLWWDTPTEDEVTLLHERAADPSYDEGGT